MLQNNVPNIRLEKEWRYERKFLIEQCSALELHAFFKIHHYGFSQIYPARYVNNIYFDYLNYDNYYDNQCGVYERCKTRIRWYGKAFEEIVQPVLELKIKRGFVGSKKSFSLASFQLNDSFDKALLDKIFANSNLPEAIFEILRFQRPTLFNRYRREYWQSCDKRFRLTIDSELTYYFISNYNNTLCQSICNPTNCVLELKYNVFDDSDVSSITNCWPFRLAKNSKYVTGVECV